MIIEVEKAIQQFHNNCKIIGESMMEDHNMVPMTIALLTQNEGKGFATAIAPDLGPLYNSKNQQVFVDAMHSIISSVKPIAIGFISEAWMVRRGKDDKHDFSIPIAEQEDRIEVLMVQIETYKDTSLTVYEMIREGDQVKIQLDEEQSKISKEKVSGLFSQLLQENYEQFSKSIEENLKNNLN